MSLSLSECAIVIRRKNGRIVASIPELRLYATGDDALSAMQAVELKLEALKNDLAQAGELAEEPGQHVGTPREWSDIRTFALKAAIVFGIGTAATLLLSLVVISRLQHMVDSTTSDLLAGTDRMARSIESNLGGGSRFWTKVTEEIERAAAPEKEMPAEQKKKLLMDIRTLASRWRPFVLEAKAILADVPSAPEPPLPSK